MAAPRKDPNARILVGKNIRFIRKTTGLTEGEYAAMFIDVKSGEPYGRTHFNNYEIGYVMAPDELIEQIAVYHNIAEDVIRTKDIAQNPGLMHINNPVNDDYTAKLLEAKDNTIRLKEKQIEVLQEQVKKLKMGTKKKLA